VLGRLRDRRLHVPGRLRHQERRDGGLLAYVGDRVEGALHHGLRDRTLGAQPFGQPVEETAQVAQYDREDQFVTSSGDAPVDRRPRQFRGGGDVLDRGLGDAEPGEALLGRVDDALARGVGGRRGHA
jgi:hypothetical protein